MSEDLINLPNIEEVKEFLEAAQEDINAALQEDKELERQHKLITEVVSFLKEQVAGKKNLDKLPLREKIAFAAHLCLLQDLLEEIFLEDIYEDEDEDLEDEDDFDNESYVDFDEEDEDEEDDDFKNKSKNLKSKK